METRASYVLVGLFVIVMASAGFAFALWMARVDLEKEPARYVAYFNGAVTGLEVGNVVRYRGVRVGSVSDIEIDPSNVERIRVTIDVEPNTPIKTDTIATLGLQGITGVAFVQLLGGTHKAPALHPEKGQQYAVIPTRPSGIETVLREAPKLLQNAVRITAQIETLLSDKNVTAVTETLENIRVLSQAVAQPAGGANALISEARQTVAELHKSIKTINALGEDLRKNIEPLSGGAQDVMTDVQVTLSDVRSATESFNKFANEMTAMVDENRPGLRDFSSSGLYELSLFVAESRQLVASLTRLAASIERDPARFFFGDTQKGFEAP